MKYILIFILAILFSGCVTDKIYNAGKVVYIGGKKVVIANSDMLDEKTLEKLKSIDDKAIRYDSSRKIIKDSVKESKKN
jgi:PBP1b-binding outer membrane lipoprotein LpoB